MEITVTKQKSHIVVINPHHKFDAHNSASVWTQLTQLLAQKVINFVIDLSDTLFLDSAGLAVVMSLAKQVRQQNGQVVLVWPRREAARRTLTLTRFDRMFAVTESTREALKCFSV